MHKEEKEDKRIGAGALFFVKLSREALNFVLYIPGLTNNVNNANGGNGGNGGNHGCTYKGFMACNPKEYDRNGGVIALTRWIKKMENNTQVQARGREAAIGMSWTNFKALLVEEFYPSNEIEKLESEFWNHKMVGANHAGYTDRFHELAKLVLHLVTPKSSHIKRARILPDEEVSCGTLTKGNEKRKGVKESSKKGGGRNDDKRAKVSKGFIAATPHRNGWHRLVLLEGIINQERVTIVESVNIIGNGYSLKDKNQAKTDKTEHRMERA
ncbi:putative reverse transcriptase domain-containing protein [Tanacetum coccineum]